jgi:DNA-binding MarR family transcriptional regulator
MSTILTKIFFCYVCMHMTLDDQLLATEKIKARSWGKIINQIKREFDAWAMLEFEKKGYTDFKMAHLPVLMNIDISGTNNNELALRTKVTKQAMSKVIKELQQMGYIKTKEGKLDKRTVTLLLTERGKKLVLDARQRMMSLHIDFNKLLGEKEFDKLIDQLLAIISFHEGK